MKTISGMSIINISLKRFKSYREMIYMEPMSKGINLIIGENGNGKSNFLDSIMYVLTDKYQNMRQDDKKLLLHEDVSLENEENNEERKNLSVELTIDNTSHRFPLEKDQISIMKIFDTVEGKEDILINNKKLLKSDIQNLLESAGFLKSNPYYIIQQGKINQMMNCTDEEYFEIFSDAMGTKIYEEKRAESLKLLEDNKHTQEKIEKQIKEIDAHIKKLEDQCVYLKDYTALDLKRKGVEYFILKEKISDFEKSINSLEANFSQSADNLKNLYSQQNLKKNEINSKLNEIKKINEHAQNLRNKIDKCQETIFDIEKSKFQKENNLESTNVTKEQIEDNLFKYKDELDKVQDSKNEAMKELESIKNEIDDIESELQNCKEEYNKLENKNNYFLLKTNDERKEYLNSEINKLEKNKEIIDSNIIEINKNHNIKINEKNVLLEKIKEAVKNIKSYQNQIEGINQELIYKKEERREITNEIKKDMIEINECSEQISLLENQLSQVSLNFPNCDIFKNIMKLKELNIQGVYGILLDILEINPIVRNAVDLILKDKLYTFIVDTMKTADKLLNENKRLNGPVINIMNLEFIGNSTNENEEEYEWVEKNTVSTNNNGFLNRDNAKLKKAKNFLEMIKLNDNFIKKNPEINQEKLKLILDNLFGKCLIVPDYETGTKYAKIYHFTCVTSINEVIYGGGYMTRMGHYDSSKQRINLFNKFTEINSKRSEFNYKKELLDKDTTQKRNKEISIQQETDSKFKERSNLSGLLEQENKELINHKKELLNIEQAIVYYEDELNKLNIQRNDFISNINLMNDILNGKMDNMSQSQIINNPKFSEKLKKLEKEIIEKENTKNDLISKKIDILEKINHEIPYKEIEITKNINICNGLIDNLKNAYSTTQSNTQYINYDIREIEIYKKKIEKYSNEIVNCGREVETLKEEKDDMLKSNDELLKSMTEIENTLSDIKLSINEKNAKKTEASKKLERLYHYDNEVVQNLDNLIAKQKKNIQNESKLNLSINNNNTFINSAINNLDVLLIPAYNMLDKINFELKKYDRINRFANDEHIEFKSKKERVETTLKDLNEKCDKIREFIQTINEKNKEFIQKTFDKAKESFSKFFKHLTGNGNATMELSLENKTIHINVNFNENTQKTQSMFQLSGGQKTAAGVALIFALSTIEKPPFYILDEIDAALDPNYRVNLASLIKELSENNQFIISTFKPELIDVADNIYKIKFANKTSNIIKIDKEEAAQFVQPL